MRFRPAASLLAAVIPLISVPTEAQWLSYPTPGIPRNADGKVDLNAPAPRAPDGKPDLSGLWQMQSPRLPLFQRPLFDIAQGLNPADVEMTPWAAAIQKQRQDRDHVDDPYGYCLPLGVPRMTAFGVFRILATPGITVFLHSTDVGPAFRQIFTDGRPLPKDPEPTWLGYSVGRWDNETLVVETNGFRDRGWLDTYVGRPHSDALHVTERFRRVDFGHIEMVVTINDPKAFVKPWSVKRVLAFQADTELLEAFCDNQQKTLEHRRIDSAPPEPPSPPLR